MLVYHGWGKAQKLMDGKSDGFPDPLGMGSEGALYGAVAGEVLAPLALILGLLTRLSALGLAFTMGVAAFVIHWDDPWSGAPKSKEMALLYMIPAVTLLLTGPGRISLDEVLWSKLRKRGGDS